MYVLVRFFRDGSGTPEVFFINSTITDRNGKSERPVADVMDEIIKNIIDLSLGDAFKLYHISSGVVSEIGTTKWFEKKGDS